MDITPPPEMINQMEPAHCRWWLWVLIVVTILVSGWLVISWFRGWFPFSFSPTSPSVPPVTQEELNSLTATRTPTTISTSTIKTLAATSSSAATVTSSILDSLTPKK